MDSRLSLFLFTLFMISVFLAGLSTLFEFLNHYASQSAYAPKMSFTGIYLINLENPSL
jgi:hypothetical protein